MTISSRTPDGHPGRCPVCRRRLRLSPSWPSADAPCPHCGSLVWFPAAPARRPPGRGPGAGLTLEDFRKQLEQWAGEDADRELRRARGMLHAMTRQERDSPDVLDGPRCRRIAAGAGVLPQDVEQFLGQFRRVREVMSQM